MYQSAMNVLPDALKIIVDSLWQLTVYALQKICANVVVTY